MTGTLFDHKATSPASRNDIPGKPRLSILLAEWAPFHAGAEVAAERLAVGLRDAGHRVIVIVGTEGESSTRLRAMGLDVRFVPLTMTDKFKWWRYRSAQRELRRQLREIRPNVIHANDLPTSQMVGAAAAKLGIPRVCHHRWTFEGPAIDWLNKFGAEQHLFVSQALKDELCMASQRLADSPGQVVHDGLALPPALSTGDQAAARRELGFPIDQLMVLFAGQIVERKGVADLLRAWKQLLYKHSQRAELVLIGDDLERRGVYRREMESLAAGIQCPAKFLGYRRDVATWITAADMCVVPSHSEPLGNATMEAMAHGRAVIGTNVGGIPEMIIDGETGFIVAPHDPPRLAAAIDTLLGDASLRCRLGQAARKRCEERFSLASHVGAVVASYRRAINQLASVAL